MRQIILDTGPLVAWFCPRDSHHPWAKEIFAGLRVPCMICEAVLTETCHLVSRDNIPPSRVIEFVTDGLLAVIPLGDELPGIRRMIHKYADTPMDFADACVTRLAERYPDASVCTTDSDFVIYRKENGDPIPLIAPFSADE